MKSREEVELTTPKHIVDIPVAMKTLKLKLKNYKTNYFFYESKVEFSGKFRFKTSKD